MTANEFGCRMYYYISSEFNGVYKVWCAESIVDYQWDSVFMGYFCNRLYIYKIYAGVSYGLNI